MEVWRDEAGLVVTGKPHCLESVLWIIKTMNTHRVELFVGHGERYDGEHQQECFKSLAASGAIISVTSAAYLGSPSDMLLLQLLFFSSSESSERTP